MALGRLSEIADGLPGAGLDPDTPAAVIASGTTPDQETALGPVSRIAETAAGLRLPPPALVVIGAVVGLSERIAARRGTLAAA